MQLEDIAHGIVARDGAARLQRHAGMAADLEFEFDDRMGVAKAGFDVAVALVDDRRLGRKARREFARRIIRVDKIDRQLLDFERSPDRRHPRRR